MSAQDRRAEPAPSDSARAAAAGGCRVSIIIKALNEEKNIVATLASALCAVARVGGEVVLADSCSSDRTVELAQAFPIRIVQLLNPAERSCGVGAQLGFEHCSGEYVYVVDGDMQMNEDFLERALDFLQRHPDIAGVAGRVVERNTESLEYRARNEKLERHRQPGVVDRLDGGGLYRRSAIESVGYLTNRNLHSYEELDLATRLRERGWTLWRLPLDAVSHLGHDTPPYRLLRRRWQSRYICGTGELLRASAGQPRQRQIFRELRELRLYLAVLIWWLLLAALAVVALWLGPSRYIAGAWATLLLAPLLIMTWRKRSLRRATYALVSWCFHAAGLLRGLATTPHPLDEPIAARVLRQPSPAPALGLPRPQLEKSSASARHATVASIGPALT
jgi:GT2 family glycosyltransferase